MYSSPSRVLFGAAYYHEYQPTPRLDVDLDLMTEACFTVIRVGESVWSTWEPDEGVFDLDWLQPVLDGAHRRGIAVVMGTPTYAVPPWLARLYPEINGERRTEQRIGWGARQEVDFTHPGFRFHAERVIRRIAERYAGHPAVIGWQVDNEPGLVLFHNHGVHQRFVDSLRRQYGDVETLNREWGLVYWSHRLATWADMWTPDGNMQPQYSLAWRRFQAVQTTEFIAWQAGIVREYSRADQFVTTCLAYVRPAVEDDAVTRALDVTAGNPYYTMQDALTLPAPEQVPQLWTTNGTWALYQTADRMFSSKQTNFLVTETNAQAIGMSWVNQPAYDGQWKQAGWALVSRGADMVEYWHWHTLHFGAETFWGGVVPHNGRPGRVYREIAELGRQFEAAGDLVTGLSPHYDVTVVYSNASNWALQEHPQLATPDGGPDPRTYQHFADPFYRGAFDAGAQQRLLHTGQFPVDADDETLAAFVGDNPVVVAAGLYIADDASLTFLRRFAEAGGHLVLGPRTGYADEEARARQDLQPGLLSDTAGVWYDEFSNLVSDLSVTSASALELQADARATQWVDGLQLVEGADTEVLATYDDGHFGRWPAVTTRAVGSGRVTVVGTVPNAAFAEALFGWILQGQLNPWRGSSGTTTATSATARDGSVLRFLHNWSAAPSTVSLPAPVRDVVTGDEHRTGDILELGPWDVRILIERR